MELTARQKAALAKAKPADRAKMKAAFLAQRTVRPQRPVAVPRAKKPTVRTATRYDPLGPPPPSTEMSGDSVYVKGSQKLSFTHHVNDLRVMFLTNPGTHSRFATILSASSLTPNDPVVQQTIELPQFGTQSGDQPGGVHSSKAATAGLTLVNSTSNLNVGGTVTVLNTDSRIHALANWGNTGFNLATLQTLASIVRSNPKSKTYSGAHFRETQKMNVHPVNNSAYERFRPYIGTSSLERVVCSGVGIIEDERPMSTVVIVFDPPSGDQDYTTTVRGSLFQRHALDSPLGAMMVPQPIATVAHINASRHLAQAMNAQFLPDSESVAQRFVNGIGMVADGVGNLHRLDQAVQEISPSYSLFRAGAGYAPALARTSQPMLGNAAMLALEDGAVI